MSSLSIGLSALDVNQQILDLIGQNIANANTPGFHRQVANLAERTAGLNIGTGVDITQFSRMVSGALDSAINQNAFETNSLSTQVDNLNQVQAFMDSGTGSVQDLLSKFFDQLQQLSTQPDDLSQRRVFLNAAGQLTDKLNSVASSFQQLQVSLDSQISDAVKQINSMAPQIADLNAAIQRATLQGRPSNELLDQRDQLINKLAGLVDVRTVPGESGAVNVLAAGVPLVLGTHAIGLQFGVDQTGKAQISAMDSRLPVTVTGGSLAGLLQTRNVSLADYRGRLNDLTQQLVQGVDGIHATGLGLTGPITSLAGQRAASSSAVPLAKANLAFSLRQGSVFISVTNLATGQRTLNQVNIDPASQSLADVANAISAVGNIQAVVNTQTNTLSILAQPGYGFDFAGRLPTAPQTTLVTGTATPQVGGSYAGTSNDTYTFRVVGSGTVGVTPNLTLEVRNAAGTLLGSANIGQGYSPGTSLPTVNGVTVALSPGTVNDGDSFATQVVAHPDTAGILTALGLNTFFTGANAGNLQVSSDIRNHPEQLAAAQTGQPGDNANLLKLAALQNQPLLASGTASLGQFYDSMVTDLGSQIQDLGQQHSAKQVLGQQLSTQQQALSGVDPNEELVRLLQFQRAFQMSARYVSLVNSTVDDLLHII